MSLDSVERLNLTLCALAIPASLVWGSPAFAGSVALGAGIEAINYRVLRSAAARLFAGELAVGQAWVAAFGLRFVALAAGIALALRAGADAVGLVIGLSLIVPAVVGSAWRSRPSVQETAAASPAPAPDDPSWDRWNPWLAREREDEEEDR